MSNVRLAYSTTTHGAGDLRAMRRHTKAVHKMYRAAMRQPEPFMPCRTILCIFEDGHTGNCDTECK